VRELAREPVEHPWFSEKETKRIPLLINVGRLAHQKRQDLLLEAFATVHKSERVRLALVGRGEYQARLFAQARELGVEDDVVFLGFQRNPWKFMSRATALVLSSSWEGLPCVLTEAMLLGVPIVSTRCQSGPTEMLLNGAGGLLCDVGSASSLAEGIGEMLGNPQLRAARVETAIAHLDRFEPKNVTRQYEALAQELADRRPS